MDHMSQGASRAVNLVFWTARIWSALVIAIMVVILVSVIGLIIAWRRLVLGSAICIGFALLNLAIYIVVGGNRPWNVLEFVVMPVILPALLFLLYGRLSPGIGN